MNHGHNIWIFNRLKYKRLSNVPLCCYRFNTVHCLDILCQFLTNFDNYFLLSIIEKVQFVPFKLVKMLWRSSLTDVQSPWGFSADGRNFFVVLHWCSFFNDWYIHLYMINFYAIGGLDRYAVIWTTCSGDHCCLWFVTRCCIREYNKNNILYYIFNG